jgi:HD-GYP domain-containing protein (c-di-GMP phosphodiesterase class II)
MSFEYSPIVIEAVDPGTFPPIALYTRQEKSYVLYRDKGVELKGSSLQSLRESGVEFLFVQDADTEFVRSYFENNLGALFSGDKLSQIGKNSVLCSVMVNYICDVYQKPDQPWMYQKCRTLLSQFQVQISERDELLELLSKVSYSGVYLFTHSAQVAILAMFMYQRLFHPNHRELVQVGLGSMLIDIGMMNVANNVVDKSGPLSNDEYFRIKHHTRDGHFIARNMGITEEVALDIILRHHEWYDGRGYPGHLSGNDIPRCAQVATICDVFSALTNDRPFRPASTLKEALETMRSERCLFNPEIFDAFEAFMAG